MNKKMVLFTLAVLTIAAVAGFFVWRKLSAPKVAEPPASLGEQIFEETSNPVKEKLPETNPFDANVNPFESTESNPLKANYQNPF